MTLAELNRLERAQFVATLGEIFEHSAWVAEEAFARRPFASLDSLHEAMMAAVRDAGQEKQLALVRAHPELAGREAVEGALTAHSTSEQSRLGFDRLSRAELERMRELNRRYREKFGFPCIVALKLHASRDSVIAAFDARLQNDAGTELASALEQVGHIAHARLEKLIGRP
ncbi:MAG: 2-oxo-4-hydroxy-4-carboxy-5-ureidoimidazoline decarboxylase [Betaproteobacteria bacterium]|nr:2-oxo-4-hydroxy-4-carboxy-5-ureidoimidazoline decarboxylase [Betaproteobacteria bacterium]